MPVTISENALSNLVAGAVRDLRPITVRNNGVGLLGESVVFDIHDLDGSPNPSLIELTSRVAAAVRPVLRSSTGLAADIQEADSWHGHLSLASHELTGRHELRFEVEAFIRGLAVPFPERFVAETISLYRLGDRHWQDGWWTTFRWDWMGSVMLGARYHPTTGNG